MLLILAAQPQTYHGNSFRNARDTWTLERNGSEMLLLKLQDFIFFYTAEKMRKQLMQQVAESYESDEPIRFIIMDFHAVDNIDATALKKFKKFIRFCDANEVEVIFCFVNKYLQEEFQRDDIYNFAKKMGYVSSTWEVDNRVHVLPRYFEEANLAVEWVTDAILSDPNRQLVHVRIDPAKGRPTLKTVSRAVLDYIKLGLKEMLEGEVYDVQEFRDVGKRYDLNDGDIVCSAGDTSSSIFYVASGSLTVWALFPDGSTHRVARQYHGTTIGEMAFFAGAPRTATV